MKDMVSLMTFVLLNSISQSLRTSNSRLQKKHLSDPIVHLFQRKGSVDKALLLLTDLSFRFLFAKLLPRQSWRTVRKLLGNFTLPGLPTQLSCAEQDVPHPLDRFMVFINQRTCREKIVICSYKTRKGLYQSSLLKLSSL